MIYDNPIFKKELMSESISYMGDAKYVLLYKNKDDKNHNKTEAGKRIREAQWILSFVIDHIFDYYPCEYFMNDDDEELFPEFKVTFLAHPSAYIGKAIQTVKKDFDFVAQPGGRMFLKARSLEIETNILNMFYEIKNNYDEFNQLIKGPKKISDPSKPQPREIKDLIECILVMLHVREYYAPNNGDMNAMMQHIQIGKMYEMFLNPLLKALEIYKCGDHTDYWKEGDSMIDYMMFEFKAKEIIPQLIMILETQSPFLIFEANRKITNGLLKIYRDMLKRI